MIWFKISILGEGNFFITLMENGTFLIYWNLLFLPNDIAKYTFSVESLFLLTIVKWKLLDNKTSYCRHIKIYMMRLWFLFIIISLHHRMDKKKANIFFQFVCVLAFRSPLITKGILPNTWSIRTTADKKEITFALVWCCLATGLKPDHSK